MEVVMEVRFNHIDLTLSLTRQNNSKFKFLMVH